MTFAAVIFDLDGTLLDTERQAFTAGQRALSQMGHSLDLALFHRLVGVDRDAGEDILRDVLGEIDFAELDRRWIAESRKLQAIGVPIKTGAVALLGQLQSRAMPCAIATSSYRDSATHKLDRAGLTGYFSAVVTRSCVTHAKPHPEPYLLAADRLGVSPGACLAFEDSDPGAAAAHAAGMRVVQVQDVAPTRGDHAHHLADTLIDGARAAGLLGRGV